MDSGYRTGDTVSPFYDALLAKLIVTERDRDYAIALAARALAEINIEGPKTNLPFLKDLLSQEEFHSGKYHTAFVEEVVRRTSLQKASTT
jgi:acetyl-CoA carboxylase biotin carboxylase subunit